MRLRNAGRVLRQKGLLRLTLLVVGSIFSSGLLITVLEPELSFADGLWWSIVTLTTVGYGDISPSTPGGRVLAGLIMLVGIGLLATFSASLAALLISMKIKENQGMCLSEAVNHIIICEWNHRVKAILKELRADAKTATASIVLLADIDEKPLDDPDLLFIRGPADEETLTKANLIKAKTVIILGDDRLEPTARDAKAVLTAMTVEQLHPEAHTVVELVDKANERHCVRAKVDEIIIASELSSHLIACAASDHGLSKIVSELLSSSYGNELYVMPLPAQMADKCFLDVFLAMKTQRNATVIGLQKKSGALFLPNPDPETMVREDDLLVVISKDRLKA
jgi:voltage-gated potassium channel